MISSFKAWKTICILNMTVESCEIRVQQTSDIILLTMKLFNYLLNPVMTFKQTLTCKEKDEDDTILVQKQRQRKDESRRAYYYGILSNYL